MRTYKGETVLTLKEASEKYFVPVTWLRKQIGKPVGTTGELLKVIKFPADKNYYLFESEVEQISKPRVYSREFIEQSQSDYEHDPDNDNSDDERLR